MADAAQQAAYRARKNAGAVWPVGRPRNPVQHGTEAGEQAHRRRDERPCESCRAALAVAQKIRRDQRRYPLTDST